jgi:hypothetical protein
MSLKVTCASLFLRIHRNLAQNYGREERALSRLRERTASSSKSAATDCFRDLDRKRTLSRFRERIASSSRALTRIVSQSSGREQRTINTKQSRIARVWVATYIMKTKAASNYTRQSEDIKGA